MSNTDELKKYISSAIGGNISDWICTSKNKITYDDVDFFVREFENTVLNKTTTIICDGIDNDFDVCNIYIKERPWRFVIWNEKSSSSVMDTEDIDEVSWQLTFYEDNNGGDFDWHVGEYLHAFKGLPIDYEEDSENQLTYSGSSFNTFGDIKNNLISLGFILTDT